MHDKLSPSYFTTISFSCFSTHCRDAIRLFHEDFEKKTSPAMVVPVIIVCALYERKRTCTYNLFTFTPRVRDQNAPTTLNNSVK